MTPKVLPEALIEELLAAAEKATPGPWFVSGVRSKLEGGTYHQINRYDEAKKADENIAAVGYDERTGLGFIDAHFIALANPQTVAALIAEVKAARASRVLQDEGVVAWRWRNIRGPNRDWHVSQAPVAPQEPTSAWAGIEVEPLYAAPPAILPSTIGGSVGVSEDAAFEPDIEMARHWIDRYAAGIDEEPQMRRIVAALTRPTKDPDNANS